MRVLRKMCVACGSACLESDMRCWACSGGNFAPTPGSQAEPEATITTAGSAPERTLMRHHVAGAPRWWVAGIVALAVATIGGGVWLGTRESPARPAPLSVSLDVPGMAGEPLPAPPIARRELRPESQVIITPIEPQASPQPFSSPSRPARVAPPHVIYRPAPPLPAPRTPSESPAAPKIPSNAAGAGPEERLPTPSPTPARSVGPSLVIAEPTETTAVVTLRNDADRAVQISFEGEREERETAVLAPGGVLPLTLGPGSYRLRVTARGAEPRESRTVLAPRRAYTLVIDGEEEADGRVALGVREPAIDGAAR